MKTTEQKIEVMQAYAAGKPIQFRVEGYEMWCDTIRGDDPYNVDLEWDWSTIEYRIKPEPLYEGWVNIYSDACKNIIHPSREMADNCAACGRIKCIQVREVREESNNNE